MSTPLQVLHIEDDPVARHYVELLLDGKVNLVSVATLKEAQELLLTHQFDLILADLYLPDSVGMETLSSWWPHFIPTIVISNDNSPATLKRADVMGAYDYVSKANLGKINLLSHIKIAVDRHREGTAKRGRWDVETFNKVKPYIACAVALAAPLAGHL